MKNEDIERLRRLTHFEDLVAYLRDELDWPIEVEDANEITFDYDPAELGIAPQHAVKIESIKQIRPLVETQPWGVFYVQFESKRLPVVVLRRILRSLVPKSRQRDPDRPVWRMSDLLFISAQGAPGYRSISFAHFRQREEEDDRVAELRRVASLRTFSWDARETHLFYIKNLNLEALRWPEDEEDPDAWREQWRRAFTVEHRYTVRTSQKLAREMARHAATVRDMVNEVYALESDEGPLHALYASFKEALLHDLTPETFADMVAQTVAYGLFSAATQTGDGPAPGLGFDTVVEQIPNTNPFLKDLLAELTSEGAVDLEELGVGQLVELLRQTDVEAILQDFGRQTGGGREDPVLHFYEDFLNAYDKEQRVQRGVFYTPDPVVSYIVRSVDYLLKTEFGLLAGDLSTATIPITLTVNAVNDAPVAANDLYTTPYATLLVVLASDGVLSNDLDVDSATLTATLLTGPAYGDLALDADGGFVYTSTVGFGGMDSFVYQATDGITTSNAATVTLDVGAAPTYTLSVDVVGQGTVAPASGVYTEGEVITLTATPDTGWQFEGWTGDVISTSNPISLTMGADQAITATFSEITANQAPTANAGDPQTVNVGAEVLLDGSTSSDPDGDTLAYLWRQGGGPAVSFTADISRTTFIAPPDPTVLTFTLTVTDTGGLSASDEVVITVEPSFHSVFLPLVMRK